VKARFVALVSSFAIAALFATPALAGPTHQPGPDFEGVPTGGACCFTGAAVDPSSGDVYVTDALDLRTFTFGNLFRFHPDGSYDASFDLTEEVETEPGVFQPASKLGLSEPQDVAIDDSGTSSDGRIYIAEGGTLRVTAIDASGALDTAFSGDGRLDLSDGAPLQRPCGLAVDQTNGNLFVADQNAGRVFIYDSAGALQGEVKDSTLQGACGIALDNTGELYVRSANNGNVYRFHRPPQLGHQL